jgi:hypothetical protein
MQPSKLSLQPIPSVNFRPAKSLPETAGWLAKIERGMV